MKKVLLIIDDERSICNVLKFTFEDEFEIETAIDIHEVNRVLKYKRVDFVLLDLKFGSISGLDILSKIKRMYPDSIIIIMTAYGTIETSKKAIKKGAYDYILKPLDLEQLKNLINNANKYYKVQKEMIINSYHSDDKEHVIIGRSPQIKKIYKIIDLVKDKNVNVLIQGESGTGKELIARAIKDNGLRKNKPFISVNCGAIPENLFESEFFGYEKGSFTGAERNKEGKFVLANEGTVFLDEIGELSQNNQVKLLRVLQDMEVTPIGGKHPIKVDVRVIAATNKNLDIEVENGNFRHDLYYRLNVIPINVPKLNERAQDIPLLIDFFIKKANKLYNLEIKGITNQALDILLNHKYLGNIRELENIIYRSTIMSSREFISEESLTMLELNSADQYNDDTFCIEIGAKLSEIERKAILETLQSVNGNKAKAARILGISERSMHYKLKEYNKISE